MNIAQMHLGVKARLDQINTPRFEDSQIDSSINTAISFILRNKVAGVVESGKRVSFQKIQMIRDELYTIVKDDDTDGGLNISGGELITNLPADYRYLLSLFLSINGVAKDWAIPISYNGLSMLSKSPYDRPSQDFPYNFYYIESADGLTTYFNKKGSDALDYAKIFYLAEPIIVFLGTRIAPSYSAPVGADTIAYAYTTCEYDGVTYKPGSSITMTAGTSLVSGTAVVGFTDSDMPPSLHQEIVEESAIILNNDIENFDKWQSMRQETQLRKQ